VVTHFSHIGEDFPTLGHVSQNRPV
jgi:hypothetical protein